MEEDMAEVSGHENMVIHPLEEGATYEGRSSSVKHNRVGCSLCEFVRFFQKVIAEMVGTYFIILAGCTSVIVNVRKDEVVTLPGIAIVWGLTVMVMLYFVGHISGAHFNPAVTVAFTTCRRFPWKQIRELAGLAIGATVMSIVIFARPISGTSINPAQSIGPAIEWNCYKGLSRAWAYNIIHFTIISQMHCQ